MPPTNENSSRQSEAAELREAIIAERQKHGLSADLKELVEKYRAYSPQYAAELESLIYPENA